MQTITIRRLGVWRKGAEVRPAHPGPVPLAHSRMPRTKELYRYNTTKIFRFYPLCGGICRIRQRLHHRVVGLVVGGRGEFNPIAWDLLVAAIALTRLVDGI